MIKENERVLSVIVPVKIYDLVKTLASIKNKSVSKFLSEILIELFEKKLGEMK